MSLYDNVAPPPSNLTGALGAWAQGVYRWSQSVPFFSYFSGLTPNSTVTGVPGRSFAINVGSASTSSRLWFMGGSGSLATVNGWVNVRILT